MKPDNAFDARLAAKKLLREGRSGALASFDAPLRRPLLLVGQRGDGNRRCAALSAVKSGAAHQKHPGGCPRFADAGRTQRRRSPGRSRVMLMGSCAKTDPAVAGAYLRRHLEAEMFANFGDFAFYRMEIGRAHLVAGFGRIVDVGPKDLLADMSDAQALVESETGAIAHMNEDHADACRLFATKLLGATRRRLALRRHRSGRPGVAARANGVKTAVSAARHRAGSAARGSEGARRPGAVKLKRGRHPNICPRRVNALSPSSSG